MIALIQRVLSARVEAAAGIDPEMRPATKPQFGHFQSNVALRLAKSEGRNPREVAAELIDRIEVDDLCEPLEVAGPGFINFRMKSSVLAQAATDLLADEKERAEHLMLVDLGRNDLGRVCEPGSVKVHRFFDIERYSHVMHLVSTVSGRLRADATATDAVLACFPAGTLSGAPKPRAMQIIEELEPTRRGLYGGIVGYLDFAGDADTAIDEIITPPDDPLARGSSGGR